MYLAWEKKVIPPIEYYHDPNIENDEYWTVAHKLANNGIIPPEEWKINALSKTKIDNTVAMYLAYNGIIPPKEY